MLLLGLFFLLIQLLWTHVPGTHVPLVCCWFADASYPLTSLVLLLLVLCLTGSWLVLMSLIGMLVIGLLVVFS
jgi:hypothetical protein